MHQWFQPQIDLGVGRVVLCWTALALTSACGSEDLAVPPPVPQASTGGAIGGQGGGLATAAMGSMGGHSQSAGGGSPADSNAGDGQTPLAVACDHVSADKLQLGLLFSLDGSVMAGSDAFLDACSFCHGSKGEGKTDGTKPIYPSLRDLAWSCGQIEALTNGIDGTAMEGFADDYDEQWLADLIAYVSTLKGALPPIIVIE